MRKLIIKKWDGKRQILPSGWLVGFRNPPATRKPLSDTAKPDKLEPEVAAERGQPEPQPA